MTDSERDRERLVGQARHLIDELDALSAQASSVPDEILSTSPLEGEPSIKELYALIGLYDRHVYLPALESMIAEEHPILADADDAELVAESSWNERPFEEVLSSTKESREELIHFVESLPLNQWNRRGVAGGRNLTVFDLVYAVVQHDAELLRVAALRFHESRPTL